MESRIADMQAMLVQMREQMSSAGQISVVASAAEVMQIRARLLTEALARHDEQARSRSEAFRADSGRMDTRRRQMSESSTRLRRASHQPGEFKHA